MNQKIVKNINTEELCPECFKVVGSESRYRLVCFLGRHKDGATVGTLTKELGLRQPTVTHHLNVLKSLDAVCMRRSVDESASTHSIEMRTVLKIVRSRIKIKNVKILSWNIWIDCDFNKLKKFLEAADADVIGLQEVKDTDPERDVIKYLMDVLGYENVFAATEQTWEGMTHRHGPAVFSRRPIIHSEKIKLEEGEGAHAAAYAQIDADGITLHIFSTHLIHTHQQPSVRQEAQVEKLIEKLPPNNVVVMGDFNATPESRAIEMMSEILVDADTEDLPTWSVYPEGCSKCNPQTIDTKLDYIFVSNNLEHHSFKVEESKASDHLPISVRIVL